MAGRIRWGILSTATINDVVIDGIRNASRSELTAVASRDPEKAGAYAAERNIPKAYGSYEELLNDPDIDAVYISVPNTLHHIWAVKAAEAGKHVLCEKPMTTEIVDFEKVAAAAALKNVTVFEAFMYLHHPQTLKIQELINDGKLGEVQLINSWFDYYLPPEERDNIRLNPSLGGGSLWDVGVYPNSLSITLAGAGPPVEVYCTQNQGETGVDESVCGHLKFSNGVVSQFSANIRTPFRAGAHIVGSKGTIIINKPWKPGLDGRESAIEYYDLNDKKEVIKFPAITPYQAEVEAMESCVLDQKEPVVPLSNSRNFLLSIKALQKSSKKGKPVKLSEQVD